MFRFWNRYDEIERQLPVKYWDTLKEFALKTAIETLSEEDRCFVLDDISDFAKWLKKGVDDEN